MGWRGHLRQSTARTVPLGPVMQSDGVTPFTSLIEDTDITLQKGSGAFGAKNDTTDCTHRSAGSHDCVLNTTDTATLGNLEIQTNPTGTLVCQDSWTVIDPVVYDALFGANGADYLQVDMVQVGGATAPTIQDQTDSIHAALIGYFQLLARSDSAINTDRATELAAINANEGSGAGDWTNQDASQEYISDFATAADNVAVASRASILSKLLKYVQLLARSDAAIATDNATELTAINADGGSGAGDYDNQGGALEDKPTAAQVNAQVLDVLVTDTFAEPANVPAATSSLKDKLCWMFTVSRNKVTQTSSTTTLKNDADDGAIATKTVDDDGTTYTSGEWA